MHENKKIDSVEKILKSGLAIVVNNALLLVRSQGDSLWQIPGGKREPGESAEDALVRELMEELGIKLQPNSVERLARFTAPAAGRPGVILELDLFSASYHGEPAPMSEIEEIYWQPIDDDAPCATAMVREHVLPYLRSASY